MMAKKSFKKGVDSLIQSTGNKKSETKPKSEKQPTTKANSNKKPVKKAASSKKPVKKENTIDLGARLTIDRVNELKKTIEEALKESDQVILKSKEVEDIDLAFIQMIKSFEKSVAEQKKSIGFDITLGKEAQELMQRSGFEEIFKKK